VLPFNKPVTSPWNARIPINAKGQTWKKLLNGFVPSAMEEKWFVYTTGFEEGETGDGNIVVHMHRSWTGLKVAEVHIRVSMPQPTRHRRQEHNLTPSELRIYEFIWESSKETTRDPDEKTIKDMARACSVGYSDYKWKNFQKFQLRYHQTTP
jgi:hypothetical protein